LDLRNNIWWGYTGGINPNSKTNICITTNAFVLFDDAGRSNTIVNPLLNGIKRNDTAGLDPRPSSGSPALNGGRTPPSDGFFTKTAYQGAFTNVNWAADWTALSEYHVLSGAGGGVPTVTTNAVVVTPNQPAIVTVAGGGILQLSFLSQLSFSYQLQSATNLVNPINWHDEGSPWAGTGSTLSTNITIPSGAGAKYFRVVVQ
jgi:hypothetical protein